MKAKLEPISSGKDESFYSRRFGQAAFDHPLHFHPEVEVVSIVKSSGSLIIGDSIGSFREGDLFLIGSNLPHVFSNGEAPDGGAVSEVLHFRSNTSGGEALFVGGEWAAFIQLLERSTLGLRFDVGTAGEAQRLLVEIREAEGLARWDRFIALAECLLRAKSSKSLATSGYTNHLRMTGAGRIERVCQYMLEHYRENVSHQEVAERFHMAPATLSRLFKKSTRKTFQDFLNELRLGHACRELGEGAASVTEIAYGSGFRNLSNFNRSFRKRFACTPREWRRNYQRLTTERGCR